MIGNHKFNRIVIFGDNIGIPQLLDAVPNNLIKGMVVSSIRPEYIKELQEIALRKQIPIFVQPKYNSTDYPIFIEEIKKMNFDLLLCTCYSLIIRKEILELVTFNAINTHWSLLPFNKGPNPTQWAIIKGENKSGVTIHYMSEELDNGDIIAQKEENILPADTWVSVNERLKNISSEFLTTHIPSILNGTNKRQKQNEEKGSINKRLTPDSPLIDFVKMSDQQIFNLIRAQVKPLNGAFIIKNGERIHFSDYLSLEEVKSLRVKYAG